MIALNIGYKVQSAKKVSQLFCTFCSELKPVARRTLGESHEVCKKVNNKS